MSWDQRLRARALNFFRLGDKGGPSNTLNDDKETNANSRVGQKRQYRLDSSRRAPRKNLAEGILSCCGFYSRSNAAFASGPTPNQKLAGYLHWMFRVNFIFLFTVMCVAFFAWVIVFAGWITLAGQLDPKCVRINGAQFGETGTKFADAFSLSWTTFATVGYGSTYPALGKQLIDD
jgi:hypothetical protein